MTIELLLGGFVTVFGLMAIIFARQLTDFLVAGNYLISARRGAVMNASQGPWSNRILGVFFMAFGTFVIVSGAMTAPESGRGPSKAWEVVGPLIAAAILALIGLVVLLSRRRLAILAAQRLRAHAGDIYQDPEADRYARMIVSTFAGWVFILAALFSAIAVIFAVGP
ncbi:hypothetical protein [Microbacterium sp. K24]|jgi:hypothetical protein|uniref:hypothetical protein n=1 Tax=Microbacterium sp. K24 TaxID=2305446 RepID=UPI00109C075A|nr:hypothetical protein [Microbacterium sp. K24]